LVLADFLSNLLYEERLNVLKLCGKRYFTEFPKVQLWKTIPLSAFQFYFRESSITIDFMFGFFTLKHYF